MGHIPRQLDPSAQMTMGIRLSPFSALLSHVLTSFGRLPQMVATGLHSTILVAPADREGTLSQ